MLVKGTLSIMPQNWPRGAEIGGSGSFRHPRGRPGILTTNGGCMRVRPTSLGAGLIAILIVLGSMSVYQAAQAVAPTFEPDPNARGCLTFYDPNGNLVTNGNISATPIAAYGVGDTPGTPGHNIATLFGARPEP